LLGSPVVLCSGSSPILPRPPALPEWGRAPSSSTRSRRAGKQKVPGRVGGGRLGGWWSLGSCVIVPVVLVVGRSWCGAAVGRSVGVPVGAGLGRGGSSPGGGGACVLPRWWWWFGLVVRFPSRWAGDWLRFGSFDSVPSPSPCSVVRSAVGCLIVACCWHRLDGVVLPRLAGWLTVLAVLVLCSACLRLIEVVGFGKGEGE